VPLRGEVRVGGSKNAALPMMAAAILADGAVVLEGVPQLTDVRTMGLLLRDLGIDVSRTADRLNSQGATGVSPVPSWGRLLICLEKLPLGNLLHDTGKMPVTPVPAPTRTSIRLETTDLRPAVARYGLVRRMRAGFCALGPLLARRGKGVVALPGGCDIGDRPVDLHLRGLATLGADVRLWRGYVVATAKRLTGATIDLRGPHGPTVTGTANVLAAATLARGTTTILGAACEPEIVDLGQLLIGMGARIAGLGTATLEIRGVDQLGGTCHAIIPDRIEAATLLLAAAITGGSATVCGTVPDHLATVIEKLREAGVQIVIDGDRITVTAEGRPLPADVVAEPYPGFPTDVQAQWTAFMTLAQGTSTVEDRVFPTRFRHVAELKRLGARIEYCGSRARIAGVASLGGAEVVASDLRASAALILAGLTARGTTIVDRIHHLDRGYERLDRKLTQLGARIERAADRCLTNPIRHDTAIRR
jgi:UDP-N-acetylglucosamine 1-carboxyvinyltransferase